MKKIVSINLLPDVRDFNPVTDELPPPLVHHLFAPCVVCSYESAP